MKALVLFSGGIDSTTALALAIDQYKNENVIALSISYGQKHTKEIEAAKKIAQYYQVEHLYLDLAKIFTYSNCSLLQHSDNEIPHESYDKQLTKTEGTPVSTYVPFRNGLFLSSAASIALSKNCNVIEMTKADIIKIGLSLNVPYELTWSCYEGNEHPCGSCGTCIDRQKAFLKNGIKDPLLGE